MKFYLVTIVVMTLISSCLKQSIPDAMLAKSSSGQGNTTATLSYEINGISVKISVADADHQSLYPYYTLGCTKNPGYYSLSGVSSTGEFTFSFYTDSLTVGNYKHTGSYGEMFITNYNNTAEFIYAASDSMSFNITSYNKGHLSGNFSGALSPMVTAGNPNTYGSPGSVLITNGSFKNIPVFY